MKYMIDRSKWVCGIKLLKSGHTLSEANRRSRRVNKMGESMLLNEVGRMCCLGQICLTDGISANDLLFIESPGVLAKKFIRNKRKLPTKTKWLVNVGRLQANSDIAAHMMTINDRLKLTQEEREAKLISIVAEAGHELEFVGELGI